VKYIAFTLKIFALHLFAIFGLSSKSNTWEYYIYHPKYKIWNLMIFYKKPAQMIEIEDEISKLSLQTIS
jgi:hypothetical protein